ncbi:MAG: indolepyruvate ferredoxin oxidoreductase subunit alpha [Chloroflexi bacterium]|nr:indolepyruvate ferredoxin oxidoreductase subunit alpha [Chloroflexota bacterium]
MTSAHRQPAQDAGQILRGDEALALGAAAAGVRVVSGYPGSPATGVFDGLVELLAPDESHVEWAPNEKVAMELAFGASLGGKRSLVVVKSVGMNIALDPLATFSLSGSHAGLVILLGDDPSGWSSQNEQDSRWMAHVAEVPIVEPLDVTHAASLMVQAFAWSEAVGTPIIVRITRAMSLARAPVERPWHLPEGVGGFVRKRNRWIVLPAYVVNRHWALHRKLLRIQQAFEASPYDVAVGEGDLGVLAIGFMYSKLREMLAETWPGFAVLGLASVWPLPEAPLINWLRNRRRVLILEEGGPFAEVQVRALAQRAGLFLEILGRDDRVVPGEGELTPVEMADALSRLNPAYQPPKREAVERPMPSRVPLCEDCPYRPALEVLIEAMERHGGRERHIVIGETGCMVRANLPPMELFDVKYGLGSGLGLAMGLSEADTGHHIVALVGDSSFFHSDINAMPYLAQSASPVTVMVLDNRTTALTGGQAHPGSDTDERGGKRRAVDLVDIIAACGVRPALFRPEQREALATAVNEALSVEELRVLVVRGPCPRYT